MFGIFDGNNHSGRLKQSFNFASAPPILPCVKVTFGKIGAQPFCKYIISDSECAMVNDAAIIFCPGRDDRARCERRPAQCVDEQERAGFLMAAE